MIDVSYHLLGENYFIPHGHCYLWKPYLVWLNVISDSSIALAYYSIPFLLVYIVRKRGDVPFNSVFFLFASFILACGTGHIMDVWTLWHPNYWLSGWIKAVTAIVSWATGVALIILIPKILELPSPAQLAEANQNLEIEILERLQTEEELRKAKLAADAANQAKSDFLANVSHELRTPLNGILGYAQILNRSKALADKERQGISIIYQCGSHLLTLINDILDLSKIEAQRLELNPHVLHLPSFLQGIAEIIRIRAEQKGIEFIYWPPSDLPDGIQADEKRLRQVLINLLGNAVKFTTQGSVTFKVDAIATSPGAKFKSKSEVTTGLHDKATYSDSSDYLLSTASAITIRFQVEDTGVGISAGALQSIFMPFEQVGDKKKQNEGTGLGLAISHQIVSMMGSQIDVQSQAGVGSIFSFQAQFPVTRNWAQAAITETGKQIVGYNGSPQTVLVVDDKWANRSVLVNLLEPLGFEVVEAENGQDGLDKAAQVKPQLIITDLLMPVMNGYEMLYELRHAQNKKLSEVCIIVSSASVSEMDQQKSLDAGGSDFLTKPVQVEELFRLLEKHLQIAWNYEPQPVGAAQESAQTVMDGDLVNFNSSFTSELFAPAVEDLETLLDLARQGRLKKLVDEAQRIKQADHKFAPFVYKISQLANAFQAEEIESLIISYMK
ncbi:MAG: response regulator [Thainema sp.]